MDKVDFTFVFMNKEESDVQLRLVNEETSQTLSFSAHSIVLRRASAVIKTMLASAEAKAKKRKEQQLQPVLELRVKGKLNLAFAFARYFYTKKLENLMLEDYIALLKMAELYQMTDLFVMCENELEDQLSPNCVCHVYEALRQTASKNFISVCIDFISAFAFLIFTEKHHLILDEPTMESLLKADDLNVLNEDQALAALVSWGQARCSLKDRDDEENETKSIDKLLPLIRWKFVKDTVTFSQLHDLASEKKWLEANGNSRECETGGYSLLSFAKILSLSHLKRIEEISSFKDPGNYDLFTFTVDRNVLLTGLTLDLIRLKSTTWDKDAKFYFNKQDLGELVKSASVSKYGFAIKMGLLSNEVYTFRVELELKKTHYDKEE